MEIIMDIRQTLIEKIIRQNTPDFVIGTSYFVQKYHTIKWQCPVHFADGVFVNKGIKNENEMELKKYNMAYPDFVLLDKKQCKFLDKAIYNADNGIYYKNPFLRKTGWYIEAFGDYWHSKKITGLDEQVHEEQVIKAYESSGNHVLILWQHDILNHWNQICLPKINDFIMKFKKSNECDDLYTIKNDFKILSDDAIKCLNDSNYYKSLNCKEAILDELSEFYHSNILPYFNQNLIDLDWKNVKEKYNNGDIYPYSVDGRKILDYFIRSRFDDCCKNSRSVNDIWNDITIMRNTIEKCLNKDNFMFNSDIIINNMIENNNYRIPKDLSLWTTINRLKKFSVENGLFYDPYAGYGERLIASFLMGMKYIGIVSNDKLKKELIDLSNYIGYNAEIYCGDVSDILFVEKTLNNRKIDLCFTKPVCYNEIYNAYCELHFNSFEDWNENWLIKMLLNCNSKMNENGSFIVSLPQSFDWSSINGININAMHYYGFNEKTEDPYFSIGKYLDIQGKDYVKCKICGICMSHLANHIVKMHNISIEQYKQKYDNKIISDVSMEIKINANKNKFNGQKKKYHKRFVYLMPDGTYAPKSDQYKKAWGVDEIKKQHIINADDTDYNDEGIQGEDYVVCVICGEKKGTLTQHLRKQHNMTKETYMQIYNAPISCTKNEEAYHNCAVKKWKTQFQNGTYVPHKDKISENNPTKQRDDITKDILQKLLNDGYTQLQMCNDLKCSDTTLRKWMNIHNLIMPSRTIVAIRKAVKNGACMNLETCTWNQVKQMLATLGKEDTMKKFGVRRTVFDTWRDEHKNDMVEIPLGLNNDEIISFFKIYGFPYSKVQDFNADKIINSIRNNKIMIDENGEIGVGASSGNDILLTFFPHFYDVYQDGGHSARWYFENKLDHILNDIRKYSESYPTVSKVRSCLIQHGRISGFRPVIAKQIYDKYCPENGIVLDPCGGWGGRMLGAYCSDKVKRYDCMQASSKTYMSLQNVKSYFNKHVENKNINVFNGAYEESIFSENTYDMIFTSPPYYCKEHYSDDYVESCNKYKTYDEWKNGFLYGFIEKSHLYLKQGGCFAVNIDDVAIGKNIFPLKDDFMEIYGKLGFQLKQKLFMKYTNRYTGQKHGQYIFILIKI